MTTNCARQKPPLMSLMGHFRQIVAISGRRLLAQHQKSKRTRQIGAQCQRLISLSLDAGKDVPHDMLRVLLNPYDQT